MDLTGAQAAYVVARSNGESIALAATRAGISDSSVRRWDNRDELEELAEDLQRNRALIALVVLDGAAEQAAQTLVDALEADRARDRLKAADSILDRTLGRAKQRVDVTSGGHPLKGYTNVTPDTWPDGDDE